MISQTIANIILQIVLVATLNIFVYFSYTTYIENQIVQSESADIVVDLTGNLRTVMSPDKLNLLKETIAPYLVVPDLSKDDRDVKANNQLLVFKTIKILIVVILIGLIIVVAMSIIYKFNITDFLIHNAIILLAVAIVEFIFLTFITIDSNYVNRKFIDTLVKFTNLQ